MNPRQLLARLRELDVNLWIEGEKLRYSAPQGALTDDLLSELAANKKAIMDLLNIAAAGKKTDARLIKPVSRDQDIPPSFSQERLLFLEQLVPETSSYNVPLALKLQGELDFEALEKSLNEIVSRHESLRTRFVNKNGQYVQIIEPEQAVVVDVISTAGEDDLMDQIEKEKSLPFDLKTGPLLRCRLLRITQQEHILLLTIHHIVCDGWSLGLLFRELSSLYAGFSEGESVSLPKLRIQCADYAVSQRKTLTGDALAKQLDYWRDRLKGLATLQLPTDYPRPPVQSYQGGFTLRKLPAELSSRLRSLSETEKATLFMTLLSAFTVLLHRYSAQDDIVVGTPIANRNSREIEDLIGFFINMLVLRCNLSGAPSFRELLSGVKKISLDAYQHQEMPFEKLVSDLRIERDLSRNPLFQVVFALQNAPLSPVNLKGLTIEPVENRVGTTRFDLEVYLWESDQGLTIRCNYNSDLFEASTIDRMLNHYQQLLGSIVENPDLSIDELRLLPAEEKNRLLRDWNRTATEFPRDETVHALFEAQVARSPDAVALSYGENELSYAELDARAKRLAHYLRASGVGPEVMVGICMERSLEMVIGMLGILKAGGAYVPLDPAYPRDRIAYIAAETRLAVLLTQQHLQNELPDIEATVMCVDSEQLKTGSNGEISTPAATSADDLAYVIYTSGSTGKPKGVMNSHRGIVNRLLWGQQSYSLQQDDRVLQKTPFSFDVSVWEIFWPLITGARLVIAKPEGHKDPLYLSGLIRDKKISSLHFVPSMLKVFLDNTDAGDFSQVKRVFCSGEALPYELQRQFFRFSNAELHNLYGPTESAVEVSYWECRRDDVRQVVPIGRPIANTQLYILDRRLQPVPVGVSGELHIGGVQVARGYLGQPELTAEKFIADPFSDQPAARLYKTGDLARFLPGGEIEYLGRTDHQVKLRGFRIELGEIENTLTQHQAVRDAVAIVREDEPGDKRLLAYVVAGDAGEPTAAELRTFIRERLPEYMVPSAFIVLDSFPLTANSKLDRSALPRPDVELLSGESYVAPQSDVEVRIAKIWCDLLRIEKAGTRDNFFDLGGHSLLMSQVQARLNEEFSRKIPMLDFFQYPTIESLAVHLVGENASAAAKTRTFEGMGNRRRSAGDPEAIAIIGMAGRFPGAATVEEYWNNLANGIEAIRFFTDAELAAAGIADEVISDNRFVPAKGYLDNADLFDAGFFGYPPREAELIDPQQRIFLECAWEALERAAYDPERYQGLIGVYAGSSTNSYCRNLFSNPEIVNASGGMQIFFSSDKDYLPTRVSYKLNLRGPSVNVQTTCSTSLVAIHEACKSLREQECDIALAGGVSVMTPRVNGYLYQDESILSPDGHCRAFSANARGTVGGEGIGIVVLKRLSEAKRDGDIIHAVILGSAINNDGSNKVGYTAPSVTGQTEVIARAQAAAEVSPGSIGYIETHGTGTKLGDPIEMVALTRAFADDSNDVGSRCAIGAVKTNIGHLDAAAGVAGILKTVLALKHEQIPPSLNFTAPNPEIDFQSIPFYVNTELKPWHTNNDNPLRAGVSSFGIGGTNAHAVLEQAPSAEKSEPGREWQLLPISAKNEAALETYTIRIADYLEQNPAVSLADVSHTLRTGRGQFEYRAAAIARDNESAAAALQGEQAGRWWTNHDVTGSPPVIFMFPGQGSQYVRMGQGLYETETVFRDIVGHCCIQLKRHINLDLREIIFVPQTSDVKQVDEQLRQTLAAQCSLFVIEYALARLWMSWGIQPVAMIGHSIGEYVAACISGAIDLDEALLLIASRGQAMKQAPAGAMISVPLAEQLVTPYLDDDLWLSVINGHSTSVVSGTAEAIDELEQRLKSNGVDALRLHTSGAFHSGLMDEVVPVLVRAANKLNISSPDIPYISNVSGTWIDPSQLEDPAYWGQHLRNTVRFAQGVDVLLERFEHGIFLEVGPGNTLSSMVRQSASDNNTQVEILSSLRHPREQLADGETVAHALAGLWLQGVNIDWQFYDKHSRRCKIELPTYPFQRQSYWVELAAEAEVGETMRSRRPLKDWFYIPSWKRLMPLKPKASAAGDGCWLVLCENEGISIEIYEWLRARDCEAICVFAGNSFVPHENGNYTIEPGNADDYCLLVESLQQNAKLPKHIIHSWSVTPVGGDEKLPGIAHEPLVMCYHSLIYLAQALGRSGSSDAVDISVISNGTHAVLKDDRVYPEKSTLLGPCSVIGQEYPNLSCRNIEIEMSRHESDVEIMMAEILNPTDDMVVAYRDGQRWIKTHEPVTLDVVNREALPIRHGGVYLITGGLGGIGLALADFLAQEYQARLVLTGRSELPPRESWSGLLARENGSSNIKLERIRAVRALEDHGAKVLVLKADVIDKNEMREVLNHARQEFGEIDGVIHSAGVPGGSVIQLQSAEIAAAVMAPKVDGTRILGELLDTLKLDFMVFCSSLASVTGAAGQVDYCSANAYQDAYAEYISAKSGIPVIAINWDTWNESGMAVNALQEMGKEKSDLKGLGFNNSEGVEVFKRVLAGMTVSQVAVSTCELSLRMPRRVIDIHSITEAELELIAPGTSSAATAKKYERPLLKTTYVEPSTEVEITICELWQELLGIDPIGIDDDFFELGGHSLLATQIIARLRTTLELELSLESIFEAPTVRQLAAFVGNRQTAAEPNDQIAQLAQQIKQMTPEQREQMLAQARRQKA